MKRYLYKFRNKDGLEVKGVFIKPACDDRIKKFGIIYLAGSVLGTVAVHRLGFDIAERLAGQGYISYLFDHSRIGESEGTLASETSHNLNKHVMDGEMVEDTLEAIRHFKTECNLEDIILIGHCGGGLTALYTANRSRDVKGALLISTPILKEGENDLSGSTGATREYQRLYTKKAASFGAWKRLLTGKTDYALLGKFIRNRLSQSFRRKDSMPSVNSRFLSDFQKTHKLKKLLMLMGDRDPGVEEYKTFADKYLNKAGESRILNETSHGFVTRESMSILFNEVDSFLKKFDE